MAKNVIELTDEEVFVLTCALESFVDTSDSEYVNSVSIAYDVWRKLPSVPTKWADVATRVIE